MSSEELSTEKPHAAMFETVCGRLGVAPTNAVYVGDSVVADVVGAMHAGMRAVWIDRLDRTWPDEYAPPSAEIRALSELPALLTGWE